MKREWITTAQLQELLGVKDRHTAYRIGRDAGARRQITRKTIRYDLQAVKEYIERQNKDRREIR